MNLKLFSFDKYNDEIQNHINEINKIRKQNILYITYEYLLFELKEKHIVNDIYNILIGLLEIDFENYKKDNTYDLSIFTVCLFEEKIDWKKYKRILVLGDYSYNMDLKKFYKENLIVPNNIIRKFIQRENILNKKIIHIKKPFCKYGMPVKDGI